MTIRQDPIQVLISYVQDIKPYHTKIYEVILSYVYGETANVTIRERFSWVFDFVFDLYHQYCIYAGWDVPAWGAFWKPGGMILKEIIEIHPGAPSTSYFSIEGDWTDFFASDQLDRGVFPITLSSIVPTTDTCTSIQPIPWNTGDAVLISSSALPYPGVVPAPLNTTTTYYVIRLDSHHFKLATSRINALALTAIDITGWGAGVLYAQLHNSKTALHDTDTFRGGAHYLHSV